MRLGKVQTTGLPPAPRRASKPDAVSALQDSFAFSSSTQLKPSLPVVEPELPPALESGAVYSGSPSVANNTVGWSGEPGLLAPPQQSHCQQIHAGLQYMDQILPGMRSKMDQLLHTPDPALQGKLDAIVAEQNHLLSAHGKLLTQPEDRLNPQQQKQRDEIEYRVDSLTQAYEATEKKLDQKNAANLRQAEQLAGAFLNRLRKHGRAQDVRDRVKLDDSAARQLATDGISSEAVGAWVNEFHHQTGLPVPARLKFRYSEERPNYTAQVDSINIGKKFSKRLALHEIAHRAEYKFPEISLANKAWVRARSHDSEPVKLSSLVPSGKYKDDEVALEDSFVNPYVGKVYKDMATEVLSMGLEHFSSDKLFTRLYQQDPEHVFLTLGAVQTMHGKESW